MFPRRKENKETKETKIPNSRSTYYQAPVESAFSSSETVYHSGLVKYRLRVSVATNIGNQRHNQEDNFYLEALALDPLFQNDFSASFTTVPTDNMTFALFDGIGGEKNGEKASEMAASMMRQYEKRLKKISSLRMLDSTVAAFATETNAAVCDMLQSNGNVSGGTTFSMLHLLGDVAKIYYLGDSRIYLFRGNELTQLTRDHTVANQKLDAGIYTAEEAINSPDFHKLTLYIGMDRDKTGINADTRPPIPLEIGYRFVLCSDGLTDMCSDAEIAHTLQCNYYNDAAALVQAACRNGGKDNVT